MTTRKADDDLPLDPSIGTHAVFISHSGLEMKRKFANQLYHNLKSRGITAFLDMEELPEGDDVRPFMLEAARRAIIQVPIFTSIYAQSTWCLDELVEMMNSKRSNNAKVLPVFYDVKPEDLKAKDGPFGDAIKAHRLKSKRNEDTIQGWETALDDASWLEGFRLETYNKFEGELLTDLVEKIVHEIQEGTLAEVNLNAVGLEERVHHVVGRFHLPEKRNVLFLLLWGMGGIGKTTLARAMRDRLRKEFRATSFVESCGDKELNLIQKSLLKNLVHQDFEGDLPIGRKCLKRGLHKKEVLIILDDVKDFKSIEEVIDLTSLHLGSLILVTSRNKNVFPHKTALSDDAFKGECYEVVPMDSVESLRLLCLHAFKKPYPEPGFEVLAERVSQACGGLALSLEVVGSYLGRNIGKEFWEDAVLKLSRNRYRDINDSLMISYEALDVDEQEMFLDVACLLIGEDKCHVECFWDGLVEGWRTGLKNLVDLCLVKVVKRNVEFSSIRTTNEKGYANQYPKFTSFITTNEKGYVNQYLLSLNEYLIMHDHLRDLGRDIVKKSGKRSRVWDNSDLRQVVQSNQGFDQIRGLATSEPILSVGLLSQMRSLQLLFLKDTQLEGDVEGLEGLEIRWLKFMRSDYSPLKLDSKVFWRLKKLLLPEQISLPYMRLKKLRIIDTTTWDLPLNYKLELGSFESLEVLDVSQLEPDNLPRSFGQLKKLRKLRMLFGQSFELPEDLGSYKNLEEVDLSWSEIRMLPSSFVQLKKLREFRMCWCYYVEQLPEDFGSLESLEELDIRGIRIKKLPSSFGQLKKLRKLQMAECDQLEQVSEDFGSLESLEELSVGGIVIMKLSSSFGQLIKLRKLCIGWCTFVELKPENDYKTRESPKELDVRGIAITKLPFLWQHKLCMGCRKLLEEHVPEDFGTIESLECCYLEYADITKLLRLYSNLMPVTPRPSSRRGSWNWNV